MNRSASTALTFALVLGAAQTTSAQENPALVAQREAQDVLARAVEASGGEEALEQLGSAHVELSGVLINFGQSARPGAPPADPPTGRVDIQMDGGNTVYRNYVGDNMTFRYVRAADGDWAHITGPNTVNVVEPAAAGPFLERVTLSPFLLAEILNRPEALRSMGSVTVDGGQYDVLTYANPRGQQVALYFDSTTGLLARSETLGQHAQYGDLVTTVSFADYRPIGGVQVPHELVRRQADNVTAESSVTAFELGVTVDGTLWEKPEDATEGQPIAVAPAGPRELEVEELAEGVFMIPDAAPNYNAMFVTYDDGILVLETPQSPAVSRAVIATIRERHPDNPIRWAVPTHYHFDHSGGVFGYVDEGITIVTTPGNEAFIREIAAAPRTIGAPGGGAADMASVETFDGNRTFGDGTRQVDLYDVGPNPHVDEIVVAYLPALKLLFVADIYGFQGEVNPANDQTLALADRLQELGLELDAVLPVHGEQATGAQFWEAVELGREQAEEGE